MAETVLLGKVRERMQKMKDRIEDFEQREFDAKSALKEAQALAYQHESDRDSIANRIDMLEKELEKVNERLEHKEARLAELEEKTEEEGNIVKELTSNEMDGDEKLNELEFMVKEAWKEASETEHRHIEIANRLTQTQNELDKVNNRYDVSLQKIERHESILSEAGENVKDLQLKDENASEKEVESEEKILFLQEQLKETLALAEDAERRAAPIDRATDDLIEQIEKYKTKKADVEAEMEGMAAICDDMELMFDE